MGVPIFLFWHGYACLIRFVHDAVRYKDLMDDPYTDLCNLLKSCGDVCGIVYCLERTTCDDLASHLSKYGFSCAGNTNCCFTICVFWWFPVILKVFAVLSAYHAGLNSKLRSTVLDDWISRKTQVVVATVAFGYGLSKCKIDFFFFLK